MVGQHAMPGGFQDVLIGITNGVVVIGHVISGDNTIPAEITMIGGKI